MKEDHRERTPSAGGIVGLDHLQLAMPAGEEERAIEFYRDRLGFTLLAKPAPLAARGGAWFSGFRGQLHLGVEDSFQPQRKAHPAFLVFDVDALAARLADAEIEVRWDDSLPDRRRFFADDPFGNRLEFLASTDGFHHRPPGEAAIERDPSDLVAAMPRPAWSPLPDPGFHGTEGRVLLRSPTLRIAELRIAPGGETSEHSAPFPIEVLVREGCGWVKVGGERAMIAAGESAHWPKDVPHQLGSDDECLLVLMVERETGESR